MAKIVTESREMFEKPYVDRTHIDETAGQWAKKNKTLKGDPGTDINVDEASVGTGTKQS